MLASSGVFLLMHMTEILCHAGDTACWQCRHIRHTLRH